jgi:hypothetical protein
MDGWKDIKEGRIGRKEGSQGRKEVKEGRREECQGRGRKEGCQIRGRERKGGRKIGEGRKRKEGIGRNKGTKEGKNAPTASEGKTVVGDNGGPTVHPAILGGKVKEGRRRKKVKKGL